MDDFKDYSTESVRGTAQPGRGENHRRRHGDAACRSREENWGPPPGSPQPPVLVYGVDRSLRALPIDSLVEHEAAEGRQRAAAIDQARQVGLLRGWTQGQRFRDSSSTRIPSRRAAVAVEAENVDPKGRFRLEGGELLDRLRVERKN
jgi:hypothetical protein